MVYGIWYSCPTHPHHDSAPQHTNSYEIGTCICIGLIPEPVPGISGRLWIPMKATVPRETKTHIPSNQENDKWQCRWQRKNCLPPHCHTHLSLLLHSLQPCFCPHHSSKTAPGTSLEVQWLRLLASTARVRSLVGELRSCMRHSQPKQNETNKQSKTKNGSCHSLWVPKSNRCYLLINFCDIF